MKKFYKVTFYTDDPREAIRRLYGEPPFKFPGKFGEVHVNKKALSKKETQELYDKENK
jgi:hypothetical protein